MSKPAVFTAVGNQQTLLTTVRDVAIAGDDEPVPLSERPATAEVRAELDQRRAVELLAAPITGVASRYAEIDEMLRGAASSGEEDLASRGRPTPSSGSPAPGSGSVSGRKGAAACQVRHRYHARSALAVHGAGRLPPAGARRGWTRQRYQRWLTEALIRLLLDDGSPAPAA